MMRWKKYVLCMMCVCCLGLMTGCGNREETRTPVTERNTGALQNDRKDNAVNDATRREDAADLENRTDREDITDRNGMADREDVTDRNDTADRNDMSDNNNGIGDAVEDLAEGAGDAGRDIVDGIEDAGDALIGNDTDLADDHTEKQNP